jgi:hypothetical protein
MASIQGKSINDMKAALSKRGGLAMQNRFAVYMQPPQASLLNLDLQGAFASALSGNFKASSIVNDPRDVALLCESCNLPGRQILSLDYQSVRQAQKLPIGYLNDDVTFTFNVTNDYFIKKMFDKWVSAVLDIEGYRIRYQNEYATDIIIQQLDKNNVPIYGVKLRNAYPITVNSMNLDNTAENSPQKLTVTVTFEDFAEEGAIDSIISSVKTGIGGITKFLNIGQLPRL